MAIPARTAHGTVLHLLATDARRGAETFAVGLAERLESFGWRNDLVALRASGTHLRLDVAVAGGGRTDPRALLRLTARARASTAIVAHGSSTLLVGALLHRATGVPWVYRNIGDPAAWGQVRGADLRIGRPLRAANAVVSLYEAAAAGLRDAYGVDLNRQRVIPNAADEQRFTPPTSVARVAARQHFDLDPSLRWLLFVGALSPEKNPLLAVRLGLARPDAGLLIVGDGPLRDEIATAAAQNRGRLRTALTLADPSPAYKAADVLLMTSRTEGLPAVAIEASLSGLPVVSTSVGAVPEIVALAGAGACVPEAGLATALDHVLESAASVNRAAIVERYSWLTVAAGWHDLLVSVASERRSER